MHKVEFWTLSLLCKTSIRLGLFPACVRSSGDASKE